MGWYVNRDGAVSGPYEKTELLKRIADGNITRSAMVREDSCTEWLPVETSPFGAALLEPGPYVRPPQSKAQRVNLANRRTVAYLIELVPVTIFELLLLSSVLPQAGLWVSTCGWLAVRDLGGASWGKKLVGLDVIATTSSGTPSIMASVLRNTTGMIPLVPLVEYVFIYLGKERMSDRLASTAVIDRSPEEKGKGSWSGMLLLALFAYCVVIGFALTER